MEWWQTLIVATVPALITALALVVQQRWSVNTELKRLEQLDKDRQQSLDLAQGERDHARQMALDERAATVAADRLTHERELRALWRDERRTAHEQLIEALEKFVSAVISATHDLHYAQDSELSADGTVPKMLSYESDRLGDGPVALMRALPRVQLLGSDESRETAAEAVRLATRLEMDVQYRRKRAYWTEQVDGGRARTFVRRNEVQEAQQQYVAAARDDLGTTA